MTRTRFRFCLPLSAALLVVLVVLLQACSPAFNWREVRPDNTTLTALLPCKPDKGSKTVPLGGPATELAMVGCDAGGATFAVAVADIRDAGKAAEVLELWQAATLANMKAPPLAAGSSTARAPLKLPGATSPVLVSAQGLKADGSGVATRAAYFSQGSQVFQAVIYAPKIDAGVAETFFGGLTFQ